MKLRSMMIYSYFLPAKMNLRKHYYERNRDLSLVPEKQYTRKVTPTRYSAVE